MKFDMHCHTKEGSVDAKVSLEDYIRRLINYGFDGMLITDHNSYKGYEKWKELSKTIKLPKPFTVLKGIEYDTRDGGHIIAILPDEVHCKLLEMRGMSMAQLEKLVHDLGGILGPAHPYGNGFFAHMHTSAARRKGKNNFLPKFDFVETFNSCTHPSANAKAKSLASKYGKPAFGGSDAHRTNVIGTAFTSFQSEIHSNNDLIRAVKNKIHTETTREATPGIFVNQHWPMKQFLVWGYWVYNKSGSLYYAKKRKRHYHTLQHSA